MLFTTPIFLFLFLPLFLSIYYLIPRQGQGRNYVALCRSILFFSWGEPLYVFLLLVGSMIAFFKVPRNVIQLPIWFNDPNGIAAENRQGVIQLSALFLSTVLLFLFAVMGMFSAGYSPFLYFRF